MKISEVIKTLEEFKEVHGDLEVLTDVKHEWPDVSEPYVRDLDPYEAKWVQLSHPARVVSF